MGWAQGCTQPFIILEKQKCQTICAGIYQSNTTTNLKESQMKSKHLLLSATLVAMGQAMAIPTPATYSPAVQEENHSPAYSIVGRDTTCQIFLYSPAPTQGLHLAYLTDEDKWVDVGQLCSSDFGPWGAEKKMYNPCVVKAKDGTWRALWGVNDHSPQFAVAYSEDLVTWRPQDYPIVKEKGVSSPVAYQMEDGSFDIYLKTSKGKRYVQASEDFRTFKEDSLAASADEILWDKDSVVVNGKMQKGDEFEVPVIHLNYILDWFKGIVQDNLENSRQLPKNENELAAIIEAENKENGTAVSVSGEVAADLVVDASKTKDISDKLIGIFFEDISRAADGGLYSELLQNGDFEYSKEDRKRQWNATTAWEGVTKVSTEDGVSKNNPHYAMIGSTPIYNIGWEGIAIKRGKAIEGKDGKRENAIYNVSFYARNIDGKSKQLVVALVDHAGEHISDAKVKVVGTDWAEYHVQLAVTDKYKGSDLDETLTDGKKNIGQHVRFAIIPKGENQIALDMVSLKPQDTYKGHGLRKDLAEAIADLKPKFVRFPGGCMLHGQGVDNIYHWKESIGPLKDRKPAYNIWNYHQTRGLGFYEYFQWCEDMGAEPLPVLAAGVPCQNSKANADGICGQQGGIPMEQMPQYIQDVLDLVEWANGDPATSKWAKIRAEAGHPAPFNLKMIGIGNEDLISTTFEERYLMICKAIKKKYPNIEVVGTVGPFHWPSSDYIEGWKVASENRNVIDAVDEHYYEQPGWFINHQDYYDSYDRKQAKVYLGEYASRGKDAKDNALAEGIHLCNVERNGDVVEMASYAPLLCKDGYSNWTPDMIYFNNNKVRESESYKMQKMFSVHSGDTYIHSDLHLPTVLKKYVGVSVVKDSKSGQAWLKVVNALPCNLKLHVIGISDKNVNIAARSAEVFAL